MSGSGLRGDDRILTTHVGSLVRPDELVAALRARRSGGDVGDEEFEAILARSVREVVSRQADVGIDVVSDGEFGKTISWSRYILERLSGFEDRPDLTERPSGPQRPLGPRLGEGRVHAATSPECA